MTHHPVFISLPYYDKEYQLLLVSMHCDLSQPLLSQSIPLEIKSLQTRFHNLTQSTDNLLGEKGSLTFKLRIPR